MVNIGAAAGTPMDDKDYRDPIQVPPISTASSPLIQVVRHIHDSTLAVLGEWGGQVKMLSVEINHSPFQACRLVGARAREAANRDNGHQNRREATGNGLDLSANCPPKGYMIPVCKNR
jgi:hypothetical protein